MSEFKHHRRHLRWHERSVLARIGIILAGTVGAAGIFVLMGFIVLWLWNWLMPAIFHLPSIDFWKAWGLLILSSILFRRHGSPSQFGRERRRKHELRERLHNLGEEDSTDQANPTHGEVL